MGLHRKVRQVLKLLEPECITRASSSRLIITQNLTHNDSVLSPWLERAPKKYCGGRARGEEQYLLQGSLPPSLFLLHSPNVPYQSEGVHPAKTLVIHAEIKRLHT